MFKNREDAGKRLVEKLKEYVKVAKTEDIAENVLILALPRGGLPIGAEIRDALDVPMDAFLVRKIGAPGYSELAMGAVAMGGVKVINEDVLRMFHPSDVEIEELVKAAEEQLRRQNIIYRKGRSVPNVKGRTVILVDDGLATGATMRAAISAIKTMSPEKIIVAVPVSATDTYYEIEKMVDKIVCLHVSSAFSSVGQWYEDFSQVTDEEVDKILYKK